MGEGESEYNEHLKCKLKLLLMLLYNESSMLFPKIGLTKSINLILAISFYWNKFTIFANDSRYFVSVKYLSAFRWRRKLPSTWNVSYLQLKVVYRAFLVNLPISLVYFNDFATLSITNRWRNCLPITFAFDICSRLPTNQSKKFACSCVFHYYGRSERSF